MSDLKTDIKNAIEFAKREEEEANNILDGYGDNYDGADGARSVSALAGELIYICEKFLAYMGTNR